MIRLFLIEFQKLWMNRASRVLTIIYFILLTLLTLFVAIKIEFGPFTIDVAETGIFNFPLIWHFNTYVADYFKIFLAVVIVSMMANEYSYGTLKQNLIDGLSKQEFIASKFITVFVFAIASTFFVFLVSLILGLLYSSYTEPSIIFSELEYILAYCIKLIGFFSFCLFLGIWVKRSAFALGFLIAWLIFENLSYGIIKFVIFKGKSNEKMFMDYIYDCYPLQALSNLLKEPYTRINFIKAAEGQLGMNTVRDYSVQGHELVIVTCWIIFFIFASYRILKKRDL